MEEITTPGLTTSCLTALAEVISAWTRRKLTLIVLERHGRVDLFEGVDLSRTMVK